MINANRYYGFDSTYGLRTDDGETGRKIGKLYAFRNKKDRDNWVANDPAHDGNLTREPMGAPEAQAWWKADLNDVPAWHEVIHI